jgi:hypothetical protein
VAEQDDEAVLVQQLMDSDWNIGTAAVTSYGVTLTFRKHYTSDVPGMETRTVHGKDRSDAIRKFLAEMEEQ